MSVVAGASEKDCDTTRTGGAGACGGAVCAGSEARFGVPTADTGGTGDNLGAGLAPNVGVGEAGPARFGARGTHPMISISPQAPTDRRRLPRPCPIVPR